MADFSSISARADAAPGFVWRMQTEAGDATAVHGFGDDPRLIIDLTVWESLEATRGRVHADPEHLAVIRRRRSAGRCCKAAGPTPRAFTFREHFAADAAPASPAVADDRRLCPA